MKIGRKNRSGSRRIVLMMAAMIDCVFLLNIYFLVTAASAPLEGELAAQVRTQDAAAVNPTGLAPQVIDVRSVGGQGVFMIGQRTMRDSAALGAVLRSLPREGGLAVRVHAGPTVGDVAAAMQAGRDAGFTEVSYVVAND